MKPAELDKIRLMREKIQEAKSIYASLDVESKNALNEHYTGSEMYPCDSLTFALRAADSTIAEAENEQSLTP